MESILFLPKFYVSLFPLNYVLLCDLILKPRQLFSCFLEALRVAFLYFWDNFGVSVLLAFADFQQRPSHTDRKLQRFDFPAFLHLAQTLWKTLSLVGNIQPRMCKFHNIPSAFYASWR